MKKFYVYFSCFCLIVGLQFQSFGQSPCAAPSTVTISDITNSSAKANWTAATGAQFYKVTVENAAKTTKFTYSTSNTNITLSMLVPGTTYNCIVNSVCADGIQSANTNAAPFTTPTALACAMPQNLATVTNTSSSIKVNWNVVTGTESYRISLRKMGIFISNPVVYTSVNPEYTFSNLLSNTTYEIKVASYCNLTQSAFGPTLTVVTPNITCSAPTTYNVSNTNFTTATLSVGATPNANSYKVEYKESTGNVYTTTTHSATATTLSLYGLKHSTLYNYKISAVCAGITSAATPVSNFSTLTAPACASATGVSAANITHFNANINFTPAAGVTTHKVTYGAANTTQNYSAQIANASTIKLSSLLPNTVYNYTLYSVCNGIQNLIGISGTFTSAAAPACNPPTNVSATNVNAFGATLTWAAVSGANTYKIYSISNGVVTNVGGTAATTFVLNNLTPSSSYSYVVACFCNNVEGAKSTPATFTTSALTNCNPPTNVTVTNIAMQNAVVSWAAVSGITAYRVKYNVVGSTALPLYFYINGKTNLTISNLQPNTNYNVSVASVCGANSSNTGTYSPTQTFKTQNILPCTTPTNVTVTNITPLSAKVSWDSVPNVTNWRINYAPVNGFSNTFYSSIKNTFTITSGLVPSTNYKLTIVANCPVNTFSDVAISNFSTPVGVVCPDNNEPNEATTSATPLAIGVTKPGSIASKTDLDFFTFSNSAAQPNIKVSLTNLPQDYDLQITNAAGAVVSSGFKIGVEDEILKINNAPVGVYYAKIIVFANQVNPYACYDIKAETSATPYGLINNNNDDEKTVASSEILAYTVYPNPTHGQFTLDFSKESKGNMNITISDLSGRVIRNETLIVNGENNIFRMDMSDINNGLYIININNGKDSKVTKFLKM